MRDLELDRERDFANVYMCLDHLVLFVCKQLLKGLVYPLYVKSAPRTGSGSAKGTVRSSRLPFVGALSFSFFIYQFFISDVDV